MSIVLAGKTTLITVGVWSLFTYGGKEGIRVGHACKASADRSGICWLLEDMMIRCWYCHTLVPDEIQALALLYDAGFEVQS